MLEDLLIKHFKYLDHKIVKIVGRFDYVYDYLTDSDHSFNFYQNRVLTIKSVRFKCFSYTTGSSVKNLDLDIELTFEFDSLTDFEFILMITLPDSVVESDKKVISYIKDAITNTFSILDNSDLTQILYKI